MGEELSDGRIGRRELLKKGALAGGLVWASPMVFSGTASAAAVGACADCATDRLFGLKFNNGDTGSCIGKPPPDGTGEFEELPTQTTGGGNCLTASAKAPPSCLDPFFDFIGSCDGVTHTWILQPSLELCQAAAKTGTDDCIRCPTGTTTDIEGDCNGPNIDIDIDDDTGVTTVTVTHPSLSHSEILFCYKGSPLDCLTPTP